MRRRSIAAPLSSPTMRAAEHDQHAVAQRDQLVELGRDQHDADAGWRRSRR